MANYVVAVPNSEEIASFLGKKGSENSITFYNRSVDGNIITALAPTSVEDKFYAVTELLTVSDIIVISSENVDKYFGELLIAAKLLGSKVLLTPENADSDIIKGVGLKNHSVVEKERLIEAITGIQKPPQESGTCRIDLDKSFNVRGIGAVALGIVTKGTVNVHDELWHTSGKKALVRSIQSQDVDIKSAGVGTRVGLGLKNIEPDNIEKGSVLSSVEHKAHKRITAEMEFTEIGKEDVVEGNFYGLGSNFSYAMAKVEKVNGKLISFALEKALALFEGDRFLLAREKSPRIFAKGIVKSVTD